MVKGNNEFPLKKQKSKVYFKKAFFEMISSSHADELDISHNIPSHSFIVDLTDSSPLFQFSTADEFCG